jgi:hypothetical protein
MGSGDEKSALCLGYIGRISDVTGDDPRGTEWLDIDSLPQMSNSTEAVEGALKGSKPLDEVEEWYQDQEKHCYGEICKWGRNFQEEIMNLTANRRKKVLAEINKMFSMILKFNTEVGLLSDNDKDFRWNNIKKMAVLVEKNICCIGYNANLAHLFYLYQKSLFCAAVVNRLEQMYTGRGSSLD